MTQYFFKTPFASEGDRQTIPRPAQTSGSVSYAQGWGPDYEKPLDTQATAKPVSRKATNQVLYDLTLSVGQYQQYGAPDYITSADNDGQAYSYMTGATVLYNGKYYVSTRDYNTNVPTAAGWQPVAYRVATQTETNEGTGAQLIVTPPTLKTALDKMQQGTETDLSAIRLAIADNKKAIGSNTEAIANNKKAIGANTDAIADNKRAIGANTEAIANNKKAIGANTDAIADNKRAIGANTDAIGTLRTDVTPHLVPVGTIIMWGTPNIPDGWLDLNGQGISQSTDPQLYALYGANLPDARGYFPRAKADDRSVLSTQEGQASRSSYCDKYDANNEPGGWYYHAAIDSGYRVITGTNNDGKNGTVKYESEEQRETRPKNIALFFIIKRG